MKQRVLVAVVGIPFLLLVLIGAPAWATMLLVAALCAVGAYELMHAVTGENGRKQLTGACVSMAVLIPALIYYQTALFAQDQYPMLATLAFLFIFLLFFSAILHYKTSSMISFADVTASIFAGVIFPLMLSCLLRLRLMHYGVVFAFVPLTIAFGSDSLALFTGMLFGRHKLAPYVSPKKTIEGAVGGLVGGVLGVLLVKWVAYGIGRLIFLTYWQAMILGVLGSLVSQIGDLSFSVIKREFGVKDYGKLLPGHGGVLDRFDSVTFVCPFIWFVFSLLE